MSDLRLLSKDPSYERITGLRKGRALGFVANVILMASLVVIALTLFVFSSFSFFLFGVLGIVAWIPLFLSSRFLLKKYAE